MQRTGPEYLNQMAYEFGDRAPCCGCTLGRGRDAQVCTCECHRAWAQFWAGEPLGAAGLGKAEWPPPSGKAKR
jgi:hypothetical protein